MTILNPRAARSGMTRWQDLVANRAERDAGSRAGGTADARSNGRSTSQLVTARRGRK
jgi:hypothetical protein